MQQIGVESNEVAFVSLDAIAVALLNLGRLKRSVNLNNLNKSKIPHACANTATTKNSQKAAKIVKLQPIVATPSASSTSLMATPTTTEKIDGDATSTKNNNETPSASVIFSDLDGTLVHYPQEFESYATIVETDEQTGNVVIEYNNSELKERRTCIPLTSTTGGISYISQRTHELIKQLRSLNNTKFIIITGARASTYTNRRPFLPQADYEFFENGGRKLEDGQLDHSWSDQFESIVGKIPHVPELAPSNIIDVSERQGVLWDIYRRLLKDGWKLDARDYTTSFRVNIKKSQGKSLDQFLKLIHDDIQIEKYNLCSSFNLGKADIYPCQSGKSNAAKHILKTLNVNAHDAIALFDDDNDIELGMLCGASFLPSVTHESVLKAKEGQPWTIMQRRGFLGTEDALERVIEMRQKAIADGR